MAKPSTDVATVLNPGPALESHLASGALAAVYLVTSADPASDRASMQDPPTADPSALRAVVAEIEAPRSRVVTRVWTWCVSIISTATTSATVCTP